MTEKNKSLPQDVLLAALDKPKDAIYPSTHRLLHEAFPNRHILETDNHYFQPWHTCEHWRIGPYDAEGFDSQFDKEWWVRKKRSYDNVYNGWLKADWSGHEILLLTLGVFGSHCRSTRWFVVAENEAIADGFFAAVCDYHSTVRGEVLVFEEGSWRADKELFRSIQGANLEDLVLHGDLAAEIETDIRLFLDQEETFQKYRIPWKRGMIFLGPPGNGKTHMIKALVNRFKLPCLYVRSFTAQYRSAQQCVANAFDRARETAPCLMILEDLDTLLDDDNRSYFLNEMDGFASNHGIVTIASCNFPEKLDAAILDRPSRFDRKYHFELPEEVDRRRYLEVFMARFDADLQLDASGLDAAAKVTHGYSFAYLKELYVSSVVRWISTDSHRSIIEVIQDQAGSLREQMTTEPPPEPSEAKRRTRHHPFVMDDDDE